MSTLAGSGDMQQWAGKSRDNCNMDLGAQGMETFSEEMTPMQSLDQRGGVSQVPEWEVGKSITGRGNSMPERPKEGELVHSGNAKRLFIRKCQAEKLRICTICSRL